MCNWYATNGKSTQLGSEVKFSSFVIGSFHKDWPLMVGMNAKWKN